MVPEWLDLMAVVIGALAGVIVAAERDLDLVGFVGMCLICALGGGLLRDITMQVGDVYALSSPWPIPLCVITALIGFAYPQAIARHPNLYEWVDMFSVALFVVAGTNKAMTYNLHVTAVLLMGTITGIGGGMLRDVFLGEIPQVFRRSNFYAMCAAAGSLCYFLCGLYIDRLVAVFATVAVVVAMRQVSLRFDIMSPTAADLGSKMAGAKNKLRKRRKRK